MRSLIEELRGKLITVPVLAASLAPVGLAQPGFGGFGGMNQHQEIVKDYDKNGDGWLNTAERKAAQQALQNQGQSRRGFGRGGPRYGAPPTPGKTLTPAEVKTYASEPFFDPRVLRTIFINFEDPDWEQEMVTFYHTDVEVPATMIVDGKTYRDVGIQFRGNTSFRQVPNGRKRSMSVSMNFLHKDQRLLGYRGFHLLNSAQDPTFMRVPVYQEIARQYIPAPKANWVRVVINGENWGIYVNAQAFNADFVEEWFHTTKGTRWKIPGSPNGRGSFAYWGDDPGSYKSTYEIHSKDEPKAWADLIHLCKVLDTTPTAKLAETLKPILDIDGILKFLALDQASINNDGYWTRLSDVDVLEDESGRFHIIPHDTNETFQEPDRMARNAGGYGVDLDPFIGANDRSHQLAFKLLSVPELRTKYLGYVRKIAENSYDWNKLSPKIAQYQALIAADVQADGRKLGSTEDFAGGVTKDVGEQGFGMDVSARPGMSLKSFFEKRRTYLLSYTERPMK